MSRLPVSLLVGGIVGGMILTGCNFVSGPGSSATATSADAIRSTPPPVTVTATPPDLLAIIPAPTATPVTPSATPTITNTPGPYAHVIQQGETLFGIILEYGHDDPYTVMDEVMALNPGFTNPDRLPSPGTTLLIPPPTSSPTPPGGELTATVIARNPPTATPPMLTMVHIVAEGQSMLGIAGQYDTTLSILRSLNPDVGWRGCNFAIPTGGPDCSPSLSIGQEIIVPAPTPTPTLSPTPSGSETPTPTPTFGPVRLLWPSPGDIVAGGPLILRWVSAGILQPDEVYQVTVYDRTTGLIYTQFTRDNTLILPSELQPTDATTHEVTWQVVVAKVGPDNHATVVGAVGEERLLQWVAAR